MPTIINSEKVDSIEELLPSFRFIYNSDGITKSISDKDLNSKESAEGHAKKLFLEMGNDIESVTVKTYSRGLRLNDVISVMLPEYKIPKDLTKNKFIVRKVITEYKGATTYDTIIGVRYD